MIFASDFQINRLRLVDHFYINGKFNCIPRGYKQMITLLIRDPNSGITGPCIFILTNLKNGVGYNRMFLILKTIFEEMALILI